MEECEPEESLMLRIHIIGHGDLERIVVTDDKNYVLDHKPDTNGGYSWNRILYDDYRPVLLAMLVPHKEVMAVETSARPYTEDNPVAYLFGEASFVFEALGAVKAVREVPRGNAAQLLELYHHLKKTGQEKEHDLASLLYNYA
jgi:hypothetical protein